MVERNWAGNHTYAARELVSPRSVDELQEVVTGSERVRALGSRHSFTGITDTDGVLVSLADLPDVAVVEVDADAATATVGAGAAYGAVAMELERQGWALATLASLPHISVAGAVATGTHGSGDSTGSLAAAVAGLELVGADGELRRLRRGDADFDGSVVGLGALGIVTRITLDLEPTYAVRQDVFTGLSWDAVEQHFDAITSTAHSTSMFTRFEAEGVRQAWFKSRAADAPTETFGALAATGPLHMLEDAPTESVTDQTGVPGPWLDRLPHFRMEFTPSRGAELQSEYLVPRRSALAAIAELRRLSATMAPVLQVAEIRTVARDALWLSSSYDTDVVGFHFTWLLDEAAVYAVLPEMEAALLPLGARPHWGKCFVAQAAELAPLYPRWEDFRGLRERVDPGRKFGNAFLDGVLG
ncbi:xylitol oxidase [Pedococcus dokdonensis]|uniref:Xylitol oxidase n=1 Tax=Pedococcus dokdonensis TaxID=443156 RepID=A0A1H0V433_9MICO|nr:FAD-binding protein [Pedococcus dokdonensis]SDP73299.1 xylitol oxidase [Pedococcus dokdonensis]